ncbi:MAG: RluA family pseudouridine synthase [Candidatus Dependentiae bacterium]
MKPNLIQHGQEFELIVDAETSQERIDIFLHQAFPSYTRSFFHRAIEDGYVKVNTQTVTKSGHKVKPGDAIFIMFPPKRNITADMVKQKNIPIKIVFKHPHFIIIEKPAGLLAHPTTSTSNEVSLSDWLLHNIDDIAHVGSVDRPGIIHRLDKLTSGLMIIPRTNYAYAQFGILFRNRDINKTYYAIVKGHPPKTGTINLLIGRHPKERNRMTTYTSEKEAKTKARNAVTHYEVEQYYEDAALVRVTLETGRTHQIRVHFAAIGHPIIGDPVYGKPSPFIDRQALHAAELQFIFDGEKIAIKSELPEDIKKIIQKLKIIH